MSDYELLLTKLKHDLTRVRNINVIALGWALTLIAFTLNLRAGSELGMLFAIMSMAVAGGIEYTNPVHRRLPVVWCIGALVTSYATWVAGWAFR